METDHKLRNKKEIVQFQKDLRRKNWDITKTESPSKTLFYNEGNISKLMSNVQKKIKKPHHPS